MLKYNLISLLNAVFLENDRSFSSSLHTNEIEKSVNLVSSSGVDGGF